MHDVGMGSVVMKGEVCQLRSFGVRWNGVAWNWRIWCVLSNMGGVGSVYLVAWAEWGFV